jgi:hypothetical protein
MIAVYSTWRFHSRDELERALDEYAEFLVPGKARMDRFQGGEGDEMLDIHDRILRQNTAIDHAMRRLYHISILSFRVLHSYYRTGYCNEANGWKRATERLAYSHDGDHTQPYRCLFYHCNSDKDRIHQADTFEILRAAAIDSLFAVHQIRSRRT